MRSIDRSLNYFRHLLSENFFRKLQYHVIACTFVIVFFQLIVQFESSIYYYYRYCFVWLQNVPQTVPNDNNIKYLQ